MRISSLDITPEAVVLKRREILRLLASGLPLAFVGCSASGPDPASAALESSLPELTPSVRGRWSSDEERTRFEDATHYNNYYEFGGGKRDPARLSAGFHPRPWNVEIAGHAERTGSVPLESLLAGIPVEERVYRMRCVEAWSMVIPWLGVPLGDVLARFRPTSRAKFVAFTSLLRPAEMPGQSSGVLDWPYREGLRIDEAMHPLTLLAIGMYGHELPNQNGAPLRLVVPWKYGFKGIKAIARIEFTETQPPTSWNLAGPREYGFYANVNPAVDHPRWSQASERRISGGGYSLLGRRLATLPFNGYAGEVSALYAGMDLVRNY